MMDDDPLRAAREKRSVPKQGVSDTASPRTPAEQGPARSGVPQSSNIQKGDADATTRETPGVGRDREEPISQRILYFGVHDYLTFDLQTPGSRWIGMD